MIGTTLDSYGGVTNFGPKGWLAIIAHKSPRCRGRGGYQWDFLGVESLNFALQRADLREHERQLVPPSAAA